MTDATLWGARDEAGWVDGYGPIPADLARELVRHTLEQGDKVWLRRLHTHPATTGQLTAMDSRQRLFRGNLPRLIRLRDRTCRTPGAMHPSGPATMPRSTGPAEVVPIVHPLAGAAAHGRLMLAGTVAAQSHGTSHAGRGPTDWRAPFR